MASYGLRKVVAPFRLVNKAAWEEGERYTDPRLTFFR
jgi:hypothetical protein